MTEDQKKQALAILEKHLMTADGSHDTEYPDYIDYGTGIFDVILKAMQEYADLKQD